MSFSKVSGRTQFSLTIDREEGTQGRIWGGGGCELTPLYFASLTPFLDAIPDPPGVQSGERFRGFPCARA